MTTISQLSFFVLVALGAFALFFQFVKGRFPKHLAIVLDLLFILALCLMSYRVWPGLGSDLERYFQIMDMTRGTSFREVLLYGHYRTTVITNIFMWFISQTRNNHLLPLLSTIIITGNIFYLIHLEGKRTTLLQSAKFSYLIVVFSVVTLMAITTCVRHAWMISLFAIAVYRDFMLNKKDFITVGLYIAACMVHTAALGLILVRFLALLKGNSKLWILLWILLSPFLQYFAESGGLLGEAVGKFFAYQEFGAEGLDIRWRIVRLGTLITLAIMCYMQRNSSPDKKYTNFYWTLVLFTIGAISVPILHFRMVDAAAITSLPIINNFYKTQSKENVLIFKLLLTILCLGQFAYHGVFIKTSVSFI